MLRQRVIENNESQRRILTTHRTRKLVLLGLVTVPLAAFVASNLVPQDFYRLGALRAPGWVLALGLAVAPVAAATRQPRSLLRAENILFFAPIFWLLLDVIQGAYPVTGVDQRDVATVFWCISVYVIGVCIAFLQRPWPLPRLIRRAARTELAGDVLLALSVSAFLLGMLNFAAPVGFSIPEMFASLGQGRWSAPWVRGRLGGWDAFLDHASYFGYLLPVLTVLVGRKVGWWTARTWMLFGLTTIMLLFLADGGGRRIVGVVWGAALVAYVMSTKRLRLSQLGIAISLVAALLWVLAFMLDYRNVGYRAAFRGDRTAPAGEARGYYHVDDNFLRFAQIIDFFPERRDFVGFSYVTWVAVRPIPRVMWPGKPVDPGFDVADLTGVRGASLTCSVLGELFASGGLLAVLFGGWLFGRLGSTANRLLDEDRGGIRNGAVLLYSFAALALFAGMRSMVDLVLMSYPILAWLVLGRIWMVWRP